MKNLSDTLNPQDRCLTLALSDSRLLGPIPCGRFIVQVRGRLGQDTTFHLCFLPEIKFDFPQEALLPNAKGGSQDFSFAMKSSYMEELAVELPSKLAAQDLVSPDKGRSYYVVVPPESEQVVLHPRFSVEGKTIVVPLEVAVPRLRWAVSGLSRADFLYWQDRPITISLQEIEDAPEARLLVRGDFGQDIPCELSLQGADHRKSFSLKNGKGGCPLAPFLDSVRESGRSRNDFHLELFFLSNRKTNIQASGKVKLRFR